MTDETLIICVPNEAGSDYNDNVYGECGLCGCGIHWRPHMPPGKHVCIQCFMIKLLPTMDDDDTMEVTPRTIEEIRRAVASADWTRKNDED